MTKATKKPTGYLRAVEVLAGQLGPGAVAEVVILHDRDCSKFKTPAGACDCSPSVRAIRPDSEAKP